MGRALPRRPKMAIPERPPANLSSHIDLLFPDHPEKRWIAQRILEKIRVRRSQGLAKEKWLYPVLEFLGEDYLRGAKELIKMVEVWDEEYPGPQ